MDRDPSTITRNLNDRAFPQPFSLASAFSDNYPLGSFALLVLISAWRLYFVVLFALYLRRPAVRTTSSLGRFGGYDETKFTVRRLARPPDLQVSPVYLFPELKIGI